MIYTLTMNPALDYDMYLDNFLYGGLNDAKNINIRGGGKGVNVSKILKILGQESVAMGFIAGFSGEIIKKDLEDNKIETDFITTAGQTRINVKINDGVIETEIAGMGATVSNNEVKLLIDKLRNLTEDDTLILSGSIPKGVSDQIYKNIVEMIEGNPKIVLDTRGNLIAKNLSRRKSENYLLLKPNVIELEQLFDTKLNSDEEIINRSKDFLDYGIKNILVSKGAEGAILINKDEVYIATVPSGKLVNSVGAGDSMIAGFISGLMRGDASHAFRLAVACGSATAYSFGMADHSSIEDMYRGVQVKKVVWTT